jgi:hypothetical protein
VAAIAYRLPCKKVVNPTVIIWNKIETATMQTIRFFLHIYDAKIRFRHFTV